MPIESVESERSFGYHHGVNANDRATMRQALTHLRKEILGAGPIKIEPNRTDDATVGVADEDAQALSEMLQALSSQRNRQQADLLGKIGAALRRLEHTPEMFGVCEECEEDIEPKRLRLMPYATLCTECQSKRDPRRGVSRKKITDYR